MLKSWSAKQFIGRIKARENGHPPKDALFEEFIRGQLPSRRSSQGKTILKILEQTAETKALPAEKRASQDPAGRISRGGLAVRPRKASACSGFQRRSYFIKKQ